MESTRQYICAYCSFACLSNDDLIDHVEMFHEVTENSDVDSKIQESNIDEEDISPVNFVACEIKEEPPDKDDISMDEMDTSFNEGHLDIEMKSREISHERRAMKLTEKSGKK